MGSTVLPLEDTYLTGRSLLLYWHFYLVYLTFGASSHLSGVFFSHNAFDFVQIHLVSVEDCHCSSPHNNDHTSLLFSPRFGLDVVEADVNAGL